LQPKLEFEGNISSTREDFLKVTHPAAHENAAALSRFYTERDEGKSARVGHYMNPRKGF
jgi:hypothetical protein